jgi:hypothetical protein
MEQQQQQAPNAYALKPTPKVTNALSVRLEKMRRLLGYTSLSHGSKKG